MSGATWRSAHDLIAEATQAEVDALADRHLVTPGEVRYLSSGLAETVDVEAEEFAADAWARAAGWERE